MNRILLSVITIRLFNFKGTSLGGGGSGSINGSITSSRPSPCTNAASHHSNIKSEHPSPVREHEAVIQSLRVHLGLGKLPRPGILLEGTELSRTEHDLQKLRNDADKKRVTIRTLKTALKSLDVTE